MKKTSEAGPVRIRKGGNEMNKYFDPKIPN